MMGASEEDEWSPGGTVAIGGWDGRGGGGLAFISSLSFAAQRTESILFVTHSSASSPKDVVRLLLSPACCCCCDCRQSAAPTTSTVVPQAPSVTWRTARVSRGVKARSPSPHPGSQRRVPRSRTRSVLVGSLHARVTRPVAS